MSEHLMPMTRKDRQAHIRQVADRLRQLREQEDKRDDLIAQMYEAVEYIMLDPDWSPGQPSVVICQDPQGAEYARCSPDTFESMRQHATCKGTLIASWIGQARAWGDDQ